MVPIEVEEFRQELRSTEVDWEMQTAIEGSWFQWRRRSAHTCQRAPIRGTTVQYEVKKRQDRGLRMKERCTGVIVQTEKCWWGYTSAHAIAAAKKRSGKECRMIYRSNNPAKGVPVGIDDLSPYQNSARDGRYDLPTASGEHLQMVYGALNQIEKPQSRQRWAEGEGGVSILAMKCWKWRN